MGGCSGGQRGGIEAGRVGWRVGGWGVKGPCHMKPILNHFRQTVSVIGNTKGR